MHKTIFTLPMLLLLLCMATACSKKTVPSVVDVKQAKQDLLQADLAFSKMCSQQGMKSAFLYYAADEAIKMDNGKFPIVGKAELTAFFKNSPAAAAINQLKWEPIKVDVAASGEMGYTFGKWELAQKDTVLYGNYVSIWKKQSNGTWKYVLDTGTTSPGKNR